jgi:hypothetical protein
MIGCTILPAEQPASASQAQPTVTCPAPPCGRRCSPLRASPAWAGRVISSATGPPPLVRPAVLYSSPPPGRHPHRPLWIAGPVSRAYHSAASVGPECCVHCIASGGRLQRSRGYLAGRRHATTLDPSMVASPCKTTRSTFSVISF